MGHAAASVQTVANAFAVMLAIYKTGNVSLESPLNSKIRAIVAVGMALGILLAGWRMVPVSGKSCLMHAGQQQDRTWASHTWHLCHQRLIIFILMMLDTFKSRLARANQQQANRMQIMTCQLV